MNIYLYRSIKVRKFTKWNVYIAENGGVLVEYIFKGVKKGQYLFNDPKEIKGSIIPLHVKDVVKWALFEAKKF